MTPLARCEWVCLPGRRWALEFQDDGTVKVFVFAGERAREQWLKRDPTRTARRYATGRRNPFVKAHRQRVSGRTNV